MPKRGDRRVAPALPLDSEGESSELDQAEWELSSQEEYEELESEGPDQLAEPESESADEQEQDGSDDTDVQESSEQGEGKEVQADDQDIRGAIAEYLDAAKRTYEIASTSGRDSGAEDDQDGDRPLDPGSDSSEDERPNRNTIGNVPLRWYKDEEHVGYDIEGSKIARRQRGDQLDWLVARNDSKQALRTIYDEYNDEEITLSREELAMIMRIRKGQFPSVDINPFEPYNDWFSRDREIMPLSAAPEPKRRFIPSKWEEQKIVKLIRAMRKGWLKTSEQKAKEAAEEREPPVYLMWGDDGMAGDGAEKTATGLSYIPAAKPKLPGHEESYNPPAEYLPTEEELAAQELLDPEDRPKFTPRAYGSLRLVPQYKDFIKDRFERCLDLYLCPRVRKKRMNVDPESLVPQLPKPRDLQPFPTTLAVTYTGHTGPVASISSHASGQWLLSGSRDGTVRVWEVRTGRCLHSWDLGAAVACVAWCPSAALHIAAVAVGTRLVLLAVGVGSDDEREATDKTLHMSSSSSNPDDSALATWSARPDGGLEVTSRFPIHRVTWHSRGDYLSTVAPSGNSQAVLVHQLSKKATQNPFRKNRGRVTCTAFHPTKPFFFVATQNNIRVYNLAKQALAKKLVGGSGAITCMAVHPSGDHVIAGSDDKRVAWFDLDLSTKPYKALRYHSQPLRACAYHRTYPLFASSSDDGTCHVFHGMVYNDLMTNPLIVPVKILRGHKVVDHAGVLDVAFHPNQPWIFTAGADSNIHLYCN